MSREGRREWLAAADIALGDANPVNLRRAAKAAMRNADHPSKIVPAIQREMEAVERSDRSRQQIESGIEETRVLMEADKPREDAAEVGELMKGLLKRLGAN